VAPARVAVAPGGADRPVPSPVTGKRSFAAALNGASLITVTCPSSSRTRCTISSSRSGTARAAVPQSGHWSRPALSAPQRPQANPGIMPSSLTSRWATAPWLTAATDTGSPTAASRPGVVLAISPARSRSRRLTQAPMTGAASSRTLAGVKVCGSAMKLPAKASRAGPGSARSRPAMLS